MLLSAGISLAILLLSRVCEQARARLVVASLLVTKISIATAAPLLLWDNFHQGRACEGTLASRSPWPHSAKKLSLKQAVAATYARWRSLEPSNLNLSSGNIGRGVFASAKLNFKGISKRLEKTSVANEQQMLGRAITEPVHGHSVSANSKSRPFLNAFRRKAPKGLVSLEPIIPPHIEGLHPLKRPEVALSQTAVHRDGQRKLFCYDSRCLEGPNGWARYNAAYG